MGIQNVMENQCWPANCGPWCEKKRGLTQVNGNCFNQLLTKKQQNLKQEHGQPIHPPYGGLAGNMCSFFGWSTEANLTCLMILRIVSQGGRYALWSDGQSMWIIILYHIFTCQCFGIYLLPKFRHIHFCVRVCLRTRFQISTEYPPNEPWFSIGSNPSN